ncbi:isocitrate lyase/phosphoenolpyruvate mutase family protein [Candidatus Nitrosopelagicus sp.]|nr:isocitrate lyase/phosphoenolpyruvate mutase family protein [Candidatus Nitrosopelagicus sp.]
MSKNQDLKEKLYGKSIVKVGGAFDAMSAKLVESAGFDAIWAGSFAISATHALPDASILTMTEFFEVASTMTNACQIPVIADCDTGYGGPSNVTHMVRKYENAGISSICIEDKIFPKQNSLLEGGQNDLLPEKEFVAKILAAKEAKQDENFLVIARIEALISGLGMQEALKRADAYEKAGADAILIHSKQKNPDEIFEFTESWKGNIPIVAIPTTYDSVKISDLYNNKIKMVIYANQTLRSAYTAMENLLKEMINAEKISDVKQKMSDMKEIFELQEMYDVKTKEKEIEAELKKLGYIN